MKRQRLLSLLAAVTLAGSIGLPGGIAERAHAAPSYNLLLNWFPEPETGGYYEAQRAGLYQKAGINTSIAPFGYSTLVMQSVISGKVAFGMVNADEVLQYRARGAKVVGIMSTFQTNDQALMWHAEDTSVKGVGDLSNHTLVYTPGAGYEPFLVQKYNYSNLKTHTYDFTLRYFASHKDAVNQCYATSEPYQAQQQGLKVKFALIADSGYNPYGDLIVTTEAMVKDHPDVVKAFVKASTQGWNDYLKTPAATNKYLQTVAGSKNYPLTTGEINYSYTTEKKLGLIDGGDARLHGLGWFNLKRWQTLQKQMVSIKFKPDVSGVDVTKVFTNQFLPPVNAM